ncbi:MAG: hypothetical protein HY904_02705 [Deltaproteobacteria bacterium]|nr:hypothetical protein [Deltaproteobacteria bacterium]
MNKHAVAAALVVGGVVGGWLARAERGGLSPSTLYYSGTLQDAAGAPLAGPHVLSFQFHKGTTTCQPPDVTLTPNATDGTFQAGVDTASCPGFFDGSDVTYDVSVDGAALVTAQPVGSVPYARHADEAVHAAPGSISTLARRTRGAVELYVRTDGDDSTCDGLADAAASAGVTRCAVTTVQRAVDLLPDVGPDACNVHVGPGTFPLPVGATAQATISRGYRVNILGAGAALTTLSGALAAAPTVAVASHGIYYASAFGGSVVGVTVADVVYYGIRGFHADNLDIADTTVQRASLGIICERSHCTLSGAVRSENNTSTGWYCAGSTRATSATSVVTLSGNTYYGVLVQFQARLSLGAPLVADNNGSMGVYCGQASHCSVAGVTVSGNNSWSLLAIQGAFLDVSGPITLTNVMYGIAATEQSRVQLLTNADTTYTFTGRSGASTALRVSGNSSMAVSTSAGKVLTWVPTGFSYGILVDAMGVFDAANAQAGSTITPGTIQVSAGSLYRRGGVFPVATSCGNSTCP